MNPICYLTGYVEYRLPKDSTAAFVNLCMREGYVYSDLLLSKDGNYSVRCSLRRSGKLEAACHREGISFLERRTWGLPAYLWRNRRRAGIAAGLAVAVLLGIRSAGMIWNIEVTGNTSVGTELVLEELREAGLFVGARLSEIDPDDVEMKLLLSSERLSWVTVNLSGTVARIQVREKQTPPSVPTERKPANLIAGESGRIVYTEILRGNAVVMAGDTVSAGDLLVSGVYDSTSVGFRWTRAAGHIYAETVREFQITVPLEALENRVTNTQTSEITLNFFGKEIKLFKSTGNPPDTCDTIESVKDYRLFGGTKLPISFCTVKEVQYEENTVMRTPGEAEELAYWQLEQEISAWIGDGYLVRKEVRTELHEGELTLVCMASGIRDIAVTFELDVDLSQIEKEQ